MFQHLSSKKIVVIGASSGIGLAVSRKTAELGAHVVMSSRSTDKLNQAITSISGHVEAIAADMLNEDSINALFEQVGSFDHLVITAVADENLLRSPIATMSTSTAQRGFEKFWGTLHGSLEALARSATLELAPIRVNVISPGGIGLQPDRQLVQRAGQPEDIAGMVLALIANPAIRGAVIDVDSGERLGNWSGNLE